MDISPAKLRYLGPAHGRGDTHRPLRCCLLLHPFLTKNPGVRGLAPELEKSGIPGIVTPDIGGAIMGDDPEIWLTYEEAAARLGIKADSVRRRAASRKWPRRQGNDGLARVRIPPDAIRIPAPDATPAITPDDPDGRLRDEIAALTVRLSEAREELASAKADASGLRDRLADTQADRDRWRGMAEKLSEAQVVPVGFWARLFGR